MLGSLTRSLKALPAVTRQSLQLSLARPMATKRFTKDHEWISVDGGVGTVGITEYAQQALGDVVFVEVPQTGQSIEVNDPVGAVESVKAASDIYAPASGEVVEGNSALEDEPGLINTSPEGDGWIAKIKLSDASQIDGLMDESGYKEFVKTLDG